MTFSKIEKELMQSIIDSPDEFDDEFVEQCKINLNLKQKKYSRPYFKYDPVTGAWVNMPATIQLSLIHI